MSLHRYAGRTAATVLAISLTASDAFAEISVSVTKPNNNDTVDATLSVVAGVTSTYEVQKVTAQVDDGTPVALTFSQNQWSGTIDVSAASYGAHNVIVTATDLVANIGTATQPFQHHTAKVVKVLSPPPFGVVRPSTNLTVTCTADGAGCPSFTVLITDLNQLSPPNFSGTDGGINQIVDLSRFEGSAVAIQSPPSSQALQYNWVDSSPRLIPQVAIETGGTIWDFDDTRILYQGWDPSLQPSGKQPVYVRDRQTGKDTLVGNASFGIYDPYRHYLNADGQGWTDGSMGPPAETVVNNGWTAFRQTSPQGVKQVWVRSPDGVETQLSVFNTDSVIEAVSPTGQVMFKNQANHKRYLRFPPALPEEINFDIGVAIPRPDGWYIALGNTIFKVSCTDHCLEYDAGALDAGSVTDAGGGSEVDGGTSSGGSSSSASGSSGSSGVTHDAGSSNGGTGDFGGSGSDSSCDVGPLRDVTCGGPLFGVSLALGALAARRRRRATRP